MATLTVDELKAMSAEEIKKLSGVKCIQVAFENGPHGRKVGMDEFKPFDQETREKFVAEIRPVLIEVAQV